MKIKKSKQAEKEIITVQVDGEKLEFHFAPVIKTDCFFLIQSPNFETLAKWILANKLTAIHGVEFEDGQPLQAKDAYELPIHILFEVVGQYTYKIREYSDEVSAAVSVEKKTTKKES